MINDIKLLLGAFFLCVSGCAELPGKSVENKRDLQAIGLQYHEYVAEFERAPPSLKDLAEFEGRYNPENNTRCKSALKTDEYVVIWSYDVAKDLSRNGNLILAYHKAVPENGGYVCFADGAVELLTREQFEATAKVDAVPSKSDQTADDATRPGD